MTTTIATIDEAARRRFETAWKQGPPRIEEFLPPEDDPCYAPTLLELVAIDLELSWRVGQGRSVDDYLARFPVLRAPEYVRELAREEDRAKAAAASALKPGATVGRYRLVEVHARGGFGVVWRAEDPALGREVALKTMAQPRDPEGRQRFVAEARVASRLEHPGVVPVHELAEGETPWYSMKLVRGKTLAELMRAFAATRGDERAIAWHHLLETYLAVARALAFAHAQGHMHRDVKPDNIVVGDYGETVLLDWGLARPITGPAEPDGTVMGTPGYMPPEQATGQVAEHDARSDVYALGVLLGELLQLDKASPRPLRAIATKATEPDKADRYEDAGALAREVERHLSNERVAAHRETWWEKLARSVRRHRTRWAVGAVTAVMAIVGTTAALLIRRDAQLRHRAEVYAEAVRDETRARAAIAAGRPAEAVSVLDGALARDSAPEDLRAQLVAIRARAARLDTLQLAKEQAWFLSGEERDASAIAEIERAVAAAGPRCAEVDAELPPERLDECRRGVHGLMLLGAVLHAKGALAKPFQAPMFCEKAYAALTRARADGPTAFGDLVQALCAKLVPSIPVPPAAKTAPSSIDAHLFGIAYLYVGALPEGLKSMLGPVLADAGLDLRNPLATSIDKFREAVRLEPNEYWHSFMLASALSTAGDYRAAGLVLEHCVALRPDYPRGLEARGGNAVLQGIVEKRAELVALGTADYDRALQLAPEDPWTHWSRAHLMELLGRSSDEIAEYMVALASDVDAVWRALPIEGDAGGLSTAPELEHARDRAAIARSTRPDDAVARTVHAAASLALGDDATAKTSVSLAVPRQPPLASVLRGILRLRAGDAAGALAELNAGEPLALAVAARAVALSKLGRAAEARPLYEALAANARTDAQRAWARARLTEK